GPGFIVPRDGGNISIDATYNGQRSRALPRFAVAPGRDAIVLATALGGWARDRGTSRGIADVAIEILDGPYAGQIQETNDSGYFAFDFFPMGVPFTIRASKAGYDEITERHPGITDLPDPR